MAKIYAPNKEYAGISAGVPFINGEGETKNPYLIEWFRAHGYDVEDQVPADDGESSEEESDPKEVYGPDKRSEPEPEEEEKPKKGKKSMKGE